MGHGEETLIRWCSSSGTAPVWEGGGRGVMGHWEIEG